jgi:hypothetical protein
MVFSGNPAAHGLFDVHSGLRPSTFIRACSVLFLWVIGVDLSLCGDIVQSIVRARELMRNNPSLMDMPVAIDC